MSTQLQPFASQLGISIWMGHLQLSFVITGTTQDTGCALVECRRDARLSDLPRGSECAQLDLLRSLFVSCATFSCCAVYALFFINGFNPSFYWLFSLFKKYSDLIVLYHFVQYGACLKCICSNENKTWCGLQLSIHYSR